MTKNEENKIEEDLEWEQRILCSDESCIGVIGPDGRCKECGLPYSGPFDTTSRESIASDIEEDDLEEDIEEDGPEEEINEESEEIETHDTETLTDSEWEQRKLCSDESCIGVIGPDGLCKECGKPYEGEEKIVNNE